MENMSFYACDICFDTNFWKILGRYIFVMSRKRHRNQDGGILVKFPDLVSVREGWSSPKAFVMKKSTQTRKKRPS